MSTILVVDDEAVIRNLAKNILTREGFEVMVAEGGRQACEVFEKQKEKIDLVILDLIMPGMDGKETYRRIAEVSPDVPVIFVTGYTANMPSPETLSEGKTGFVQKPYDIDALIKEVERVLDR
jgi:two-component system cell cycle sensor histidine kinase/response regulator CckA